MNASTNKSKGESARKSLASTTPKGIKKETKNSSTGCRRSERIREQAKQTPARGNETKGPNGKKKSVSARRGSKGEVVLQDGVTSSDHPEVEQIDKNLIDPSERPPTELLLLSDLGNSPLFTDRHWISPVSLADEDDHNDYPVNYSDDDSAPSDRMSAESLVPRCGVLQKLQMIVDQDEDRGIEQLIQERSVPAGQVENFFISRFGEMWNMVQGPLVLRTIEHLKSTSTNDSILHGWESFAKRTHRRMDLYKETTICDDYVKDEPMSEGYEQEE